MTSLVATLAETTRKLLQGGGNLQSIDGEERIKPDDLKRQLKARAGASVGSPAEVDLAAATVVSAADSALRKQVNGSLGTLTDEEYSALELIVELIGRPALRYVDGKVQPPESDLAENEHWTVVVAGVRDKINAVSASVAKLALRRLDDSEQHLGTGWRLGADLLVTNRHVVELMVANRTQSPAAWKLDPARPCIADFAFTDQTSAPKSFAIGALAYCAADVDAAVLRLEPANQLPAPLTPDFDAHSVGRKKGPAGEFKGAEIYVVGHPLRKAGTPESRKVFGDVDGRKRCSPGRTTREDDSLPQFEHDCSTLGGNSGSAVMTVFEHKVIGLHFGGRGADAAAVKGEANVAVAFARLGQHRLADILRTGVV